MDNHHVHISTSQMSCGVAELSQIGSDFHKVAYAIATSLYHPSRGQPVAAVMWSDVKNSNGEELYKQLIALNVGTLVCVPSLENPKTGNIITVYLFQIDHTKFRAWYISERVERARRG